MSTVAKFINTETEETLTRFEFNKFVWDETKRQFKDNHNELWENLTLDEQLELFSEQYDYELEVLHWKEI